MHHVFLGLAFLPLTAARGRTSLVLCGFFAGLFVQGLAAWGWAPIWMQVARAVPAALRLDASLLPAVPLPVLAAPPLPTEITLYVPPLNSSAFGGAVVWLNTVEVYRGRAGRNFTRRGLRPHTPYAFRLGRLDYMGAAHAAAGELSVWTARSNATNATMPAAAQQLESIAKFQK